MKRLCISKPSADNKLLILKLVFLNDTGCKICMEYDMYLLNHKIWEGTPCNNDELFKCLKRVFRKWFEMVVTYMKVFYLALLKFYFKML